MTTRRRLLAGIGTAALGGLAGCSTLERLAGQRDRPNQRVQLDGTVPPTTLPASPLPMELPASLVDAHRTRAAALLASVPPHPAIPNGAIAGRLERERERLRERVDAGSDATAPTERLDEWRYVRQSAASLAGQYRAATGTDEGTRVRERRDALREALSDLVADLEYRAADPVEAVLVYAPVEDLLAEVARQTRPSPPYPASPLERVRQAGEAVGAVEDAAAALADARGIRDAVPSDGRAPTGQWATLAAASRHLGFGVDVSGRVVERYRDRQATDVFDGAVEGTVAEPLFQTARFEVDPEARERRAHRRDGEFASAILACGFELVGVAILRSVVDAVEKGTFVRAATADTVRAGARTARTAIQAVGPGPHPHLTAALARPALDYYRRGQRHLEEDHADPEDVEAAFRYAALQARAAPKAAAYVLDRIDEARS